MQYKNRDNDRTDMIEKRPGRKNICTPDGNQNRQGADRIATVMPGIGGQSWALDSLAGGARRVGGARGCRHLLTDQVLTGYHGVP